MNIETTLQSCFQTKMFVDRCSRRNRDIYEAFQQNGFDLAKSFDSLATAHKNTLLTAVNQNASQINSNSRFLTYLTSKLPADLPKDFFHLDNAQFQTILNWAVNNIDLNDYENWLKLPPPIVEIKTQTNVQPHINAIRSLAEITDILNGKFHHRGIETKDSPNSSPPEPRNRQAGISMRKIN